jgi:hypothetical protein
LFVGRRRRASPAVCLRWLPVWLPRNLISFANRLIRHTADRSGEIRVGIGGASDNLPLTGSFSLHGPERTVGAERVQRTESRIGPV